MTTTGGRIKARRTQIGMTQLALAYAVETAPSQIYRYEKDENDPSGAVLIALAKALRTTTDYLLGLVDDPEVHPLEPELNPDQRAAVDAITEEDYELASRILASMKKKGSHESKLPSPKASKA
ncbi:hypothetical protein ANRL4_01498 [Anaerolineae bacterium]|nr:hypothetical protein ANRL4_01498 [Anaerolineae bacterium]